MLSANVALRKKLSEGYQQALGMRAHCALRRHVYILIRHKRQH